MRRTRLFLLVSLLAVACANPDAVTADATTGEELDPVEVVEAWVEARNAGDWDTQAELSSSDVVRHGFGTHDETLAAVALNRTIHLERCSVTLESPSVGTLVACNVTVTDMIVDAAGVVAKNVNDSTFVVRGGRIARAPEWIPSSYLAEQAIENWGIANERRGYQSACPDGIAGQDVLTGLECALWIADSHPGWVESVQSVGLK